MSLLRRISHVNVADWLWFITGLAVAGWNFYASIKPNNPARWFSLLLVGLVLLVVVRIWHRDIWPVLGVCRRCLGHGCFNLVTIDLTEGKTVVDQVTQELHPCPNCRAGKAYREAARLAATSKDEPKVTPSDRMLLLDYLAGRRRMTDDELKQLGDRIIRNAEKEEGNGT